MASYFEARRPRRVYSLTCLFHFLSAAAAIPSAIIKPELEAFDYCRRYRRPRIFPVAAAINRSRWLADDSAMMERMADEASR